MTLPPNYQAISALTALYNNNSVAKKLFDWLALRERDASETTIDRVMNRTGADRSAAYEVMDALGNIGVVKLIKGRHTAKTRVEWKYSCISIGKAAQGSDKVLDVPNNPIDDDVVQERDTSNNAVPPQVTLKDAIREAKLSLSQRLGVNETDIEIKISI